MTPLRNSTLSAPAFAALRPREVEHLVGHVDAVGEPGSADPAGREQDVDAAARAEVEHPLALPQLSHHHRVAAAEAGGDRRLRELALLGCRVQIRAEHRPTSASEEQHVASSPASVDGAQHWSESTSSRGLRPAGAITAAAAAAYRARTSSRTSMSVISRLASVMSLHLSQGRRVSGLGRATHLAVDVADGGEGVVDGAVLAQVSVGQLDPALRFVRDHLQRVTDLGEPGGLSWRCAMTSTCAFS